MIWMGKITSRHKKADSAGNDQTSNAAAKQMYAVVALNICPASI